MLPEGVYRFQKTRLPKDYLAALPAEHLQFRRIDHAEIPFEFMMNALRLNAGVPASYYQERTGTELAALQQQLVTLRQRQLLVADEQHLACTEQGHRFLNSVLETFL